MKVLLEFENSHHYIREYEEEKKLFCPNCGKQKVWVEKGEEDYYTGQNHICICCNYIFSLPSLCAAPKEYKRIAEQLRKKEIYNPITIKGH